ncbi:hypothetical protein BTA51_09885 [Hahella sp. CCB-MM4]|nr:hypothetical protein BTA51_09885 [Hahella sp. CCB-MM4]
MGSASKAFYKKLGNAKLRKEPVEIEEKSCRWSRKKNKRFRQPRLCPFCLANIHSQYIGAKIKHYGSCKACGAVKQGANCSHCKSKNIWRMDNKFKCKNCGMQAEINIF